jgi:hypothetical protein
MQALPFSKDSQADNREEQQMSTSITIEADGITATVSCKDDEMVFEDFMRSVVEPAIIASGYSQKLLDEWCAVAPQS